MVSRLPPALRAPSSLVAYARLVDLLSAGLFCAFGIAGVVLARDYRLGTAANMGPGYFPTLVSIALTVVGLGIGVRAGAGAGPIEDVRVPRLRGPLVLLACVLLFAAGIDTVGLVLSSLMLVVGCRLAAPGFRLGEALALGLGLATVATLAFAEGLGLPFRVWPFSS
ncbi:tripartite tricarboxylate transporter TctB family protein [Xanthobacter sp. V4C-4]|uniref:tripartite tricarboxylate transporter TctB family protein n=1 Tax=Xanthobacter cornucopiae TaxID=3119924 RepID=UPI00372AE04E